jgi:hypothetical protein
MSYPFPQVGPGAAEMRGDFLAVGDQIDDLHPEVRDALHMRAGGVRPR